MKHLVDQCRQAEEIMDAFELWLGEICQPVNRVISRYIQPVSFIAAVVVFLLVCVKLAAVGG